MMQEIFLFIDLDDTLFQTQRKNSQGIIPATRTALTGKGSYMTPAQKLFFDLFNESQKVKIIPTTARDLEQYRHTRLSHSARIETAILYFAGMILEKGKAEKQWQQRIQQSYQQLEQPISQLLREVKAILANHSQFILYNVDDYYIVVKAKPDCPIVIRETIFSRLRQIEIKEYFIHQNDRALSLLPKFLDKKFAVQYLIEKYQPNLTLGVGDSVTDLSFMAVCDFRVFPKNAQIDGLIRTT